MASSRKPPELDGGPEFADNAGIQEGRQVPIGPSGRRTLSGLGTWAGHDGPIRRDAGGAEMQPIRQPRFTIGRFMIWIAALAAMLAIPRLIRSPDRPILFCSVGVLATVCLLNALIDACLGGPCPLCGRLSLRRLARHRHYYRCVACRAQLKRFGFGPWLDASGPEDAARYRKPSGAGVWKGFDIPRDLKGSSSGVLLGSKRSRDLLEEVKQHPPRPSAARPLEEAQRKVRDFLLRRRDMEE